MLSLGRPAPLARICRLRPGGGVQGCRAGAARGSQPPRIPADIAFDARDIFSVHQVGVFSLNMIHESGMCKRIAVRVKGARSKVKQEAEKYF